MPLPKLRVSFNYKAISVPDPRALPLMHFPPRRPAHSADRLRLPGKLCRLGRGLGRIDFLVDDRAEVTFGNRQVIGGLEVDPEFRAGAEIAAEAQSRLRTD